MSKVKKNSERSNESIVWTFSKARRFNPFKRVHTPEYSDIPSTLSDRSCSFGRGKRWTPVNETGKDAPSPGTYDAPSGFGGKNKGPSMKKRPSLMLAKQVIPGPGSYTPYSPLGKNAPKFTFRQKTFKEVRCSTPPPGTYKPTFGSVEKSVCKNISFTKGRRPEIYGKIEKIPGPGSYEVKSSFGVEAFTHRSSSKILIKRVKTPIH